MKPAILPQVMALACFACIPFSHAASPIEQQDTPRWWEACTMADPAEFRPANDGDYGDLWSHWKRATGSSHPWRAEADFNGDGLTDVAWVAMHRQQRGKWMLGVDYGRKEGGPCRFAQLQALDDFDRLPALLVWPKDTPSLLCHAGETLHVARCSAPDWNSFRNRDSAALLVADRHPLEVSVFVNRWLRADASQPDLYSPTDESDPRALRRFQSRKPVIEVDWAESKRLQDTIAPKAIETPEPLRAAFAQLPSLPHYIRYSERGAEGQPQHVVTELHFVAPDSYFELQRGGGVIRETLMLGERGWYRADGGDWIALPAGMKGLIELPALPQLLGSASIDRHGAGAQARIRVSARAQNGFGDFEYQAELDAGSGRLISETSSFGEAQEGERVRYDYSQAPRLPKAPGAQ
jgi:hypothetical protein